MVKGNEHTRFGAPQGPDPVETGRRGGQKSARLRKRPTVFEGLMKRLDNDEEFKAVVDAWLDAIKGGDQKALAKLVDRETPMARIVEEVKADGQSTITRDTSIIIEGGPTLEHPPAMPDTVEEDSDNGQ